MRSNIQITSAVLTILTMIASFSVSYIVNNSVFSTISVVELRNYGGVTFVDIKNLELWRIATAQLVHSKMPHMLFNALCLFLLGGLLERRLGALRTVLIWLIAGGIATVLSPILVEAPFNVGTGASQATFAYAGCALVLAVSSPIDRSLLIAFSLFTVIPGVTLDIIFAGFLKPGHFMGLTFGAIFGLRYLAVWKMSLQHT